MKRSVEVCAVVLAKADSGERFFKLHLLTQEQGGLYALARRPSASRKSKSPGALPDIFDLARIQLESPNHNDGLYFLRNYELERRHNSIAADYKHLNEASRFIRLLAANINQMLHSEELFQLTVRTLHHLETPADPQLVGLKALYLLLRNEGYPVSERWLASLSSSDRSRVKKLLTLELDPPEQRPDNDINISHFIQKLLDWAARETDFTLP